MVLFAARDVRFVFDFIDGELVELAVADVGPAGVGGWFEFIGSAGVGGDSRGAEPSVAAEVDSDWGGDADGRNRDDRTTVARLVGEEHVVGDSDCGHDFAGMGVLGGATSGVLLVTDRYWCGEWGMVAFGWFYRGDYHGDSFVARSKRRCRSIVFRKVTLNKT